VSYHDPDANGFPEKIDNDDPALVAMRAQRTAIELSDSPSELRAALALPMLHRGLLFGFVLLGEKPDRSVYRPDEIEALGHATHQVGLDFHELKIDQLEREGVRLAEQLRRLELENAFYRERAPLRQGVAE
jgi:hypothetical protein